MGLTLIDQLPLLIGWTGAFLLFYRLIPHHPPPSSSFGRKKKRVPKVSIVVPARNEEKNLPRLLKSLKDLNYPRYDVLVVDDQSTDQTASIVKKFGFKLIKGTPPPRGWNGKNWACHQAISKVKGEVLLFTDADTHHKRDSLKRAVAFLVNSKSQMLSALPYHRVETWWEKWMGPFYAFLLAATAPHSPRPNRLFAIGQYLMFERKHYLKQGGHKKVANQYPDDLALANACIKSKGNYRIFQGAPLFHVRMYASFIEFVQGWRRNFLAGIQQSTWKATAEVFLFFFAVTGGGYFFSNITSLLIMSVTLSVIGTAQKNWGKFSLAGVFFFPLPLLVFCWITLLAVWDYTQGNVLRWKGRHYTGWVGERGKA